MQILDIAIGLVFVYLLLSLVCTTVMELVASLFLTRARTLAGGIRQLLDVAGEHGLAEKFYQQPLVRGVSSRGLPWIGGTRLRSRPSYIPARTFALSLLDMIDPAKGNGRDLASLRAAIDASTALPGHLKQSLRILMDDADGRVEKLQENLEVWYNNSMDRVTGWYKRQAQLITFGIAVVVAVLANADTIEITRTLSRDDALRSSLVAQAQEMAKLPADSLRTVVFPGDTVPSRRLRIEERIERVQGMGIPLGWKDAEGKSLGPWEGLNAVPKGEGASKLAGLLLSAIALSLGAPFWFDVLNKVVNVRGAGRAPDEKAKTPEAPAKRFEEKPTK